MGGELVLVTGGSGFLGAHCVLARLKAGYRVRTTVRSAKREADAIARGSACCDRRKPDPARIAQKSK